MAKILVHVTTGPNDPTKAALAFLVAKTVVQEGHELSIFVAGDAVHLLTAVTAQSIEGLGTGKLSEHLEAINAVAPKVYFSGMSAKARSISPDQVVLKGAEAAMPAKLVQLATEADVVLCY